jgi:predicted 3-demethylubiquinone-9 3-methyltransferase (glyoxalase superfamily)/uncharacterized protein YndB with AHSA1/START domain
MGAPGSATKREVVITRIFDAPRGLVFKAWTHPEHMARWWGPQGFTNPICELDARVGGAWRIVMRSPAGIEYPCGGVYREIVEPERLVFTNIATDNEGNPVLDGLTTVIFAEHGGKTKLTLQTRAVAVVTYAAAYLAGMEAGWTQSLERLAEELAKSQGIEESNNMQKITPCLWFDGRTEDAANFYVSIFKNSRITAVSRYGDAGPGPKGGVMTVAFELDGQSFTGLNGGPMFKFTEAISMIVNCETQSEVDHYWEKLSAGGQTQQCGWLKDKFGVSWQIVPAALVALICDKDPVKSQRVMQAMLQMTKIDIASLREPRAR